MWFGFLWLIPKGVFKTFHEVQLSMNKYIQTTPTTIELNEFKIVLKQIVFVKFRSVF